MYCGTSRGRTNKQKSDQRLLCSIRFIQARKAFPYSRGGHSGVRCNIGESRVSTWGTGIHGEHLSHTGGCQCSESYWKHRASWHAELSGNCWLCCSLQVNILICRQRSTRSFPNEAFLTTFTTLTARFCLQGCTMPYWLEDFGEAQTIPEQHVWQPYSGGSLCWGFEQWWQL